MLVGRISGCDRYGSLALNIGRIFFGVLKLVVEIRLHIREHSDAVFYLRVVLVKLIVGKLKSRLYVKFVGRIEQTCAVLVLARIAKERYGMTLHRAIIENRIATAANLLACESQTVEQISLAVGFQSKCCFYREFVKKYGVTPIEYRRQMCRETET